MLMENHSASELPQAQLRASTLLSVLTPQVTPPSLNLRDRLLLSREAIVVTLSERPISIVLEDAPDDPAALMLSLSIGKEAAALHLSSDMIAWLQQPLKLGGSVQHEDPLQRSMLLELASLDLVRALEAHEGQAIRFGEGKVDDLPLLIGVRISAGEADFVCRLDLTEVLAQRLAETLDQLQPPQPPDYSDTTVEIALQAGAQELSAAELASLRPGDIVMLDPASPRAVVGGKFAAPVQRRTVGFQLEAPLAPLPARASAGSIELCVITFEFGRLSSTLGAVDDLAAGSLLAVALEDETGVDIVFEDRRVGRGEVLQIGEGTGVRIVHLAPTSAQPSVS